VNAFPGRTKTSLETCNGTDCPDVSGAQALNSHGDDTVLLPAVHSACLYTLWGKPGGGWHRGPDPGGQHMTALALSSTTTCLYRGNLDYVL
jgi:hypothetical protein